MLNIYFSVCAIEETGGVQVGLAFVAAETILVDQSRLGHQFLGLENL